MITIKNYLKNYWWKYIIIVAVIVLDIVTKAVFVPQNESQWLSYSVLGDFLWIKPMRNTGAGFSILEGKIWLLITITFAFIILLAIFDIRYKHKSVLFGISTALILTGAIGNLIDRLAFGYVRDFLYFKSLEFPVFNIADSSLSVGVFLMFIYIIFFVPSDAQQSGVKQISVVKQSIEAFDKKSQVQDETLEKQIVKNERIKSAQKKQQQKVKTLKVQKKSFSKSKTKTTKKTTKSNNIAEQKANNIETEIQSQNLSINPFNEDDLREVVEKELKDTENNGND